MTEKITLKTMLGIINHGSRKDIRSKLARAGDFIKAQPLLGKVTAEPSFAASSGCVKKLLNNRLLAAAGGYVFDRLTPHLELVSLAADNELYAEEEINPYVYFPETAVVSHRCNLADGNTMEIMMIGCEGATGLCPVLGSRRSLHQAVVTLGGNARRIKTSVLRQEFLRDAKLQMLLFDYNNTHLAQVSQRVVCTSFHPLEKRLCNWLLMLCDRAKENQLKVTHGFISNMLGVRREGVTLAAQKLAKRNLIENLRGAIKIIDRQGLEAAACECYLTVY